MAVAEQPLRALARSGAAAGMRSLVRKLHAYAGLLSFTVLLIYGIAGLTVTFHAGPGEHPNEQPVRFVNFDPPAGATDEQLASLAYEKLRPMLFGPLSPPNPEKDSHGRLRLAFWSINGTHEATLLAAEKRIRIESRRTGFWNYLNELHTATEVENAATLPLRLWAILNQFVMFTMLFLAASGIFLWLVSRPKFRPAMILLGAGTAAMVLVYVAMR
jgi:hypothetical protein